ncbi:MAG: type II secretion system protein N [Moraxellaceae bacterium]|nr:type II secretion system protein N [Moraxellaceae bacterium]
MLRKVVFTLALALLFVMLLAPASVWDARLRKATGGSLALLDTQGSAWNGDARLAVLDPANGRWRPVTRLSWSFEPRRLLSAEFLWRFSVADGAPFSLAATPGGVRAEGVSLQVPARFALERIPHMFGRAGWRGDLSIQIPGLLCSWRGRCDGKAQATWRGAAADLFQGRALGDYQLLANASDGSVSLALQTISGDVRLSGTGELDPQGRLRASGVVEGDPAFVGRLPNIAGQWVTQESPARFRFNVSY